MKNSYYLILYVLYTSLLFTLPGCFSGSNFKNSGQASVKSDNSILKFIQAIPDVVVEQGEPDSVFRETYVIRLMQPLDHNNPDGKKFEQRIFLGHLDFSKPVVFITEGYSLRKNYIRELSEIFHANQIRVEHRFFGESVPDSMDWLFLNIRQSAADHHRIVKLFKDVYKDRWISAGWSKGGQTALFHRRFYPDDIDVTVAYDAPLNFSLQEPRIDEFFENVGTEYCRQKLITFQRQVLSQKNRDIAAFQMVYQRKRVQILFWFGKSL